MPTCSRPIYAELFASVLFAFAPVAYGSAAAGSYSVLYRFKDKADGALPSNGLAADADGNVYGMTTRGGNNNCGTIFTLTKPAPGGTLWTLKVLHQSKNNS